MSPTRLPLVAASCVLLPLLASAAAIAQPCRGTKIVRNCTPNNQERTLYTCFYVKVPCDFQMGTIASAFEILKYPVVRVQGGVSSFDAFPYY